MDYKAKSISAESCKTACVIVAIYEAAELSPAAAAINQYTNNVITEVLAAGDLSDKIGSTLILYHLPNIAAKRVLLVRCGAANKLKLKTYQEILQAVVKVLGTHNITDAVSFLTELHVGEFNLVWHARQTILSLESALYRFDNCKTESKDKPAKSLQKFTLAYTDKKQTSKAEAGIAQGIAIANGINRTKTLGNLPGNICTPNYLADQARQLMQEFAGLKTTVLGEAALKKHGMNTLLSVARGSKEPPCLITMQYCPVGVNKQSAPLVLVGKGITFDTGGISLKPGAAMDEMKFDMCGAATVIGVIAACAELKLPIHLIGILACAENMPGGNATKPGDIVTSMAGKTIEILNTDAEGRLVLCDALTYAERFRPAAVIDIATLTGACVIALGRHPSGILGNNAELINSLKIAGDDSGDRVWELPLWEDYREALESNFADLANVGNREGGSITAASFLSHFTENYPWAHLDIAGTAWKTGKEKGATGRPVPLLMQYILNHYKGQ